jgi:hypothetical protein
MRMCEAVGFISFVACVNIHPFIHLLIRPSTHSFIPSMFSGPRVGKTAAGVPKTNTLPCSYIHYKKYLQI